MKAKDKNLRDEYPSDLIKSGVRGKFAKRFQDEGTNLVLIEDGQRESPTAPIAILAAA
jgi:hypothetical protein